MVNFYKKVILFWFVLLVLALINATLRETTYKPLLAPHIGIWAHQLSSVTGIVLFAIAIYIFIKKMKSNFADRHWLSAGLTWISMTLIFETWMNMSVRKMSLIQVLETYYFWKGETWIFVLLSLIVLPVMFNRVINSQIK